MTRIVCLSDTHTKVSTIKVPDGDILVHAGDLTFRGTVPEITKELFDISKLPHRWKIIIAGNHDWLFEREHSLAENICRENKLIYLRDSGVGNDITGIPFNFWGSPWQPEFGAWAFNLPRGDPIKEKWDLIPDDTDVLITHGPPLNRRDAVKRWDAFSVGGKQYSENYERVGCWDLDKAVKRVKPKLHVFGHIHGGYGAERSKDTLFVNASNCTERYDATNPPVVVEINEKEAVVVEGGKPDWCMGHDSPKSECFHETHVWSE